MTLSTIRATCFATVPETSLAPPARVENLEAERFSNYLPQVTAGACNVIYSFQQSGLGPFGGLAMDAAGNLYGTTLYQGAFHAGTVFELSPSNGSWIYTDLHDFSGGADDGCNPYGDVSLDRNGNLFGTTYNCGTTDNGVVWEITP